MMPVLFINNSGAFVCDDIGAVFPIWKPAPQDTVCKFIDGVLNQAVNIEEDFNQIHYDLMAMMQ